tara:strand:+ start:5595 stop:5810 length:216 start_codon:yes stop_codon:yes gene_type:complete
MSSISIIDAYQLYYNRKMRKRERENNCFYDYVRRQMKHKKKFSDETFGMVCRICYQLGEPIQNWIPTKNKI